METQTNYNFTDEEKDLLISLLEHTKDGLDISEAMEYGQTINDILDKLECD